MNVYINHQFINYIILFWNSGFRLILYTVMFCQHNMTKYYDKNNFESIILISINKYTIWRFVILEYLDTRMYLGMIIILKNYFYYLPGYLSATWNAYT